MKPTTTTWYPFCDNNLTVASPIPELLPVTSATFAMIIDYCSFEADEIISRVAIVMAFRILECC